MRTTFGVGLVAVAFAVAGAACSFTRDLDYLQDAKGIDAGLGPGDDTKDAGSSETTDAVAVDAGCAPGTIIRPASFFQWAGPVAMGQEPQALACHEGNVLADDGEVAKLDRTTNGAEGKSAPFNNDVLVAGCVGVQFDPAIELETVAVKLGPIPDACGVSPCVEGDPDGCNSATGHQAYLIVGADQQLPNIKLAGTLKFDAVAVARENLAVKTDTRDVIRGAHVAIVCRNGNVSVTRDDVAVDAIWAECN